MNPLTNEMALEMLGAELGGALVEARGRTNDDTILVRIGDSPDDTPMPGLASIERQGVSTVYGLSTTDAIAQLTALN